jgi:6-pyruvoyltetrahydropterin/6-carboxytetrahydropterin synthase
MLLTLYTEGWYDAAHSLSNYEGACKNLHGHTYKVSLWVIGTSSQLDKAGILFDFSNLKKLTQQLDHSEKGNINNIIGRNSTAENQCLWFYNKLKKINGKLQFKVRVYEQLQPKKSWCECGDF